MSNQKKGGAYNMPQKAKEQFWNELQRKLYPQAFEQLKETELDLPENVLQKCAVIVQNLTPSDLGSSLNSFKEDKEAFVNDLNEGQATYWHVERMSTRLKLLSDWHFGSSLAWGEALECLRESIDQVANHITDKVKELSEPIYKENPQMRLGAKAAQLK